MEKWHYRFSGARGCWWIDWYVERGKKSVYVLSYGVYPTKKLAIAEAKKLIFLN